MIHLRKIVITPVLYFPPHLFSAPLLYLVTQATNLTDIHSDTPGKILPGNVEFPLAKREKDGEGKGGEGEEPSGTPYSPLVRGV